MAAELSMTCSQVAEILGNKYGMKAKEKALLAYLLDDSKSRNIGDMCRALKTTARTLLSKTQPELTKKLDLIPNSDGPAVTLIDG
jgi:hypothetical protein